ncbi:MAG: hypothetical protein JSS62_00285 [Verrucomicrobia bacterium]|nr:hypothetical protein [Verrucomicrobiota bacterium]MBS0646573.1 hypothetical protein [Verrucomicrobiota bacterium]
MEPSTSALHVVHLQRYQDAKHTAVALGGVAIVLASATFLLWGFGTSPGGVLTGISFVPYMVGTLVGTVNIGVVAGVALFALKMGYHSFRMH